MNGRPHVEDPLAPSRFHFWRSATVWVTIVLCALAYSFRLTSFLHAKEAVLAASLCILGLLAIVDKAFPVEGLRAYRPLWLLLAYAFVVHVMFRQAQSPWYTIIEITHGAALLLTAAYAYELLWRPGGKGRVFGAIVASCVLVAGLGLLQYLGLLPALFPVFPEYGQQVYSVFGNQDLFGGYIAIALPILVYLFFRRNGGGWLELVAISVLTPALLVSASRTAWLAATAGILVAVPYTRLEKKKVLPLAVVALVLVTVTCLAAPKPTVQRLVQSFGEGDTGARARLWFWDSTLRMIRSAPLVGVGLGNYRYWSPYYQGEALHAQGGVNHYRNEVHTLHAHSDPLEIMAESGLAGLVFVAWMLAKILRRRDRAWGGGAAVGGLVALAVFSLFNATYQSPAHALLGLLLAGSMMARGDEGTVSPAPPRKGLRYAPYAVAVASWCAAAATLGFTVLPSYGLRLAEQGEGEAAEALYRRVTDLPWADAASREAWGMVLMSAHRDGEAREQLTEARKGLDTGRIHYLLAALAAEDGDFDLATAEFEACLWRWPGYANAWTGLLAVVPPSERAERLKEARRWLSADEVAGLGR